MEESSFFNDVDGDRIYYAEDFAEYFIPFFTNGIFNNGCQVLGNTNDMAVNVSIGRAFINGYRYRNKQSKTLTIENADGVLSRIDNIVIRLDLTNRNISTQVIKGSFSNNPVAPDLTRTSTIYDLRIAKVYIPAGATEITQDLIEDCRFINSDCGNVISPIKTPDTEQLFIQMQAIFDKFIADSTNGFDTWFDSIKNQLDSDAAGNLQNQINNLNSNKVDNAKYDLDSKNLQLLANGKNVGDSIHIPTGITDTSTGEEDLKIVNNKGIAKFSLEGKTEQKSYTGKNIFDYITNLLTSENGLTNTINTDKSITTTGTPTKDFAYITKDYVITDMLEDGQTYTISQAIASNKLYLQINARKKSDKTYIHIAINSDNVKSKSFKVDKSTYDLYSINIQTTTMSIWGSSSLTITNKYMLCIGTDTADSSFEPYVGATPSPNLDYPQLINNVKGVENIWFGGESTTVNGVTFTKNDDGSYDITGTATADANCYGYANIADSKLVNNKVYTISINKLYSSSVGILTETLADSTWVSHAITPLVVNNNISNYKYMTIPDNVTKIRYGLRVTKGTTVDVKGLKIQLEEGTIAHTFVLPGSNYLILNNKSNNLANIKDIKIGKNWVNLNDSVKASILNIPVKPNTLYTLDSNININSHLTTIRIVQFDKLGSTAHLGIKSGKFVTDNNVNYVSIEILADMTISEDMLKNIWISLAEGDVAPNIPYFNHDILIDLKGNNLCSNSYKTINDELIVENGRAKIYKKYDEYVFTGNENIEKYGLYKGMYLYNVDKITKGLTSEEYPYGAGISTHFKWCEPKKDYNEDMPFVRFKFNDGSRFYFGMNEDKTLEEFKELLKSLYTSGNPVVIQYELAEPEVIDLGEVDFELLEGSSILNLEEDLKSNMYIKYYTDSTVVDLNKKVENKQNVILHGTTAPSNDLGEDGDIYLQHN